VVPIASVFFSCDAKHLALICLGLGNEHFGKQLMLHELVKLPPSETIMVVDYRTFFPEEAKQTIQDKGGLLIEASSFHQACMTLVNDLQEED